MKIDEYMEEFPATFGGVEDRTRRKYFEELN